MKNLILDIDLRFRSYHLDDGMLFFNLETFLHDYHDQYGNIMQFTGLQDNNRNKRPIYIFLAIMWIAIFIINFSIYANNTLN